MAINIIGGNINVLADSGSFNSDRSGWGFSDGSRWVATRALYSSPADNYSCQTYFDSAPVFGDKTIPAKILTPAVGKKYIARCYVKINAAVDKPYTSGQIRISAENYSKISDVTFTLDDIVGTWKQLELRFEHPGGTLPDNLVEIELYNISGPASGTFYVDDFTIYEYEDVVETCTLAIDAANTVIVDESAAAAADGSITVAITGGIGNITYSKDSIINFQTSNQFTGLTGGIYTIYVRDDGVAFCADSEAFSVNTGSASFDFTAVVTDETVSGAADGQIDVTVTGTGGPFTYSKDGGSNYQAGNIFTGLAAGSYTIVVKDAADKTVSRIYTVNAGIAQFQAAYLSKNYIPLELPETANSTKDNYQIYVDVRVEDVAGSGSYASKLKTAMPPDASGKAVFNLRPAFRGVLTADPPTYNNGAITVLTDRIKLFKIYYGDLFDDLTTPGSLTATSPYLVSKGGISKRKYPGMNYLTGYLLTAMKFLTWAPTRKDVDLNQEDFLNFFIYKDGIDTVNLVGKAYYDDDTTLEQTLKTKTGLVFGNLLQLPAGPGNSGAIYIDPAKELSKYELWLTDQAGAVISEVRTYVITQFKHPRTRYYLFLNSLGAYETLRTIGFSSQKADIERTFSEKLLPHNYAANDGQFNNGLATKKNTTAVSSGYFAGSMARLWLEYMQEVALSRQVYDVTSGSRIPLINNTKSVVVRNNQDNKRFVRLSFVEAYSDENFTPDAT